MEVSPRFYYPTEDKYPFDNVCRKIVYALEKLNWKFPGINVKFLDTNIGTTTVFRQVYTITGAFFKILFSRKQGCIGPLEDSSDDTAAVKKINIFKKELEVFSDESGPELFVYVGKDWEKESHQFINGEKVMAKTKKKPRTYLKYVGAASINPNQMQLLTKNRKLAEYLVATNDLNREYSPEKDEPTYYKTDTIFLEFVSALENCVLKEIDNSGY